MGLLEVVGLKSYKPTETDLLVQKNIDQYIQNFAPKLDLKESIRQAIIDIGDIFVGVHEIGTTNTGYWVSRFQKDMHLNGEAWCLSYLQFDYKTASQLHKIDLDILPYDTAGTQTLWSWAENRGYTFTDYTLLKPADIIIWRNGRTALGHTGFVKSTKQNMVTSNEGNTNSLFSRDGGFVVSKEFDILQWGEIGKATKINRYVRGFISFDALFHAQYPQ